MKRLFLLLLATLAVSSGFSSNSVSVSSGQGHPKDTVELLVNLTNTDEVVAAEFIIPLSSQLKYVEGTSELAEERKNSHEISAAFVDSTLRVYIYNLTKAALKGNEGGLFRFKLALGKMPKEYVLTPTIILSDADGKALKTEVNAGKVTILAPQISVITPSIDYGHIPIRSTYSESFTVKNTGNEPLVIKGMTFSSSELSVKDDTCTIAAGQSKKIALDYAPLLRDSLKGAVFIQSNAINGEQSVNVIADPYSVNILTIGKASGICDDTVTISVSLENMEPIVGYQGIIILPQTARYVESSFIAGDQMSGFTATSSISGDTLLMVMYNMKNHSIEEGQHEIATFQLILNGKSGTYTLDPRKVVLSNLQLENMVSSVVKGNISINSPVYKGENSLLMSTSSVTETSEGNYTITNNGNVDLTISKISFLSEGFSLNEELPIVLSPKQDKTIKITYKGKVSGDYSSTMNVYSNDPDNRMFTVNVKGTLFEPNTLSLKAKGSKSDFFIDICLDNYSEIVAVQLDLKCSSPITINTEEIEKTTRTEGMNTSCVALTDSTYRIVLYSMSMNSIEGNEESILSIPIHGAEALTGDTVTVYNIILSDVKSRNMSTQDSAFVILKDDYNGIANIDAKQPYVVGCYDINGRLLRKPKKGINLLRMSNGTTRKVLE